MPQKLNALADIMAEEFDRLKWLNEVCVRMDELGLAAFKDCGTYVLEAALVASSERMHDKISELVEAEADPAGGSANC